MGAFLQGKPCLRDLKVAIGHISHCYLRKKEIVESVQTALVKLASPNGLTKENVNNSINRTISKKFLNMASFFSEVVLVSVYICSIYRTHAVTKKSGTHVLNML